MRGGSAAVLHCRDHNTSGSTPKPFFPCKASPLTLSITRLSRQAVYQRMVSLQLMSDTSVLCRF